MEPFIQKPHQCQHSDDTSDDSQNANKLVILRTTKKKVSSAQFSTLIGGEKPLKEYIKATDLQEIYAGIDMIACELSFAKSGNEQKGKEVMASLEEAISSATGVLLLLYGVVVVF
jgi:hypothetical protein